MMLHKGILSSFFYLCYNNFIIGDNMNVIVRKYNDSDFASADKLLFEAFGYHKEMIKDDRVFEFVACLGEDVVGYYNVMEEIDIIRNLKIYHIGYVCVDAQHRGNGLGRFMMEYAIQYARKQHVNRIELTSGNQREAAHRLYLSLGFEKRNTSVFRKELL